MAILKKSKSAPSTGAEWKTRCGGISTSLRIVLVAFYAMSASGDDFEPYHPHHGHHRRDPGPPGGEVAERWCRSNMTRGVEHDKMTELEMVPDE